MPLLWRYLLRSYLRVFLLCVSGFISVLLVIRFQTIARFAATGASWKFTLKFILLQIPFVLPLAIPISCLIAALLLFKKMSKTNELTSLRVAGIGLGPVAFPLLISGLALSMLNFTIVSEISPKCRAESKGLIYQMTAVNPLCLLQKETLVKLKNTFVDLKVLRSGEFAEDLIFITESRSNQRLGMMLAKKLYLKDEKLVGENLTFISSIDSKNPGSFDHLVIENQAEMETRSGQITQFLKSSDWNFGYDYLNMRMLQAKNSLEAPKGKALSPKALIEIAKRVSLALAAFTFTLTGIAFGTEISRDRRKRSTLWPAALAALYLITFIAAKSIKHDPILSASLFLAPHAILILSSLFAFYRVSRGTE